MSVTIKGLEDYKRAEVLGLNPSDRAPNDYLRFTSRVFNSFKPISPMKTISSYINGFETTIRKKILDGADNLEFYIRKGSCFVDDQFIAFKEDTIFNIDESKIVANVDYYLVIYYQYTNQCLYNPAIFKYIPVTSYDDSSMLKIIKFKMDGYNLVVYPQNLDDMFLSNYGRLFKLVSDKAADLFKINSYQGIDISENKVYVNTVSPEYSTVSGDVVFLDLDGLYKPARSCNRKIDKAMGIYVYNPTSGAHKIVTNGIIDFGEKLHIDTSNDLLLNMEPGKSYYLLDNCSETNYAWENGRQPVPGKMSSRFTPGNVRVGFAINNTKFMVDFDFASDMDTANFLELIGLPKQFQDRFNVIFAYWNSTQSKEFRDLFKTELQHLKETLANTKNTYNTSKDTQKTDYLAKQQTYNTATLASTPHVTIGTGTSKVTGPISTTRLKNTLVSENGVLNTYQSEQEFKTAKINYLLNYLPTFKSNLSSKISEMTTLINYFTNIKSNLTSDGAANIYFKDEYQIPAFSSTLDVLTFSKSIKLPIIKTISSDGSTTVSVKEVPSTTKVAGDSASSTSNKNVSYNRVNTSDGANNIGKALEVRIDASTTNYTATNNTVGTNNPISTFRSNLTVLISTLTNIKTTLSNMKTATGLLKTAVGTYNDSDIVKLLRSSGSEASFKKESISLKNLLFGTSSSSSLSEIISETYGVADYLEKIKYFIDNHDNNIDFDKFTTNINFNNYDMYYISRYLTQEAEVVHSYLSNLTGTEADNNTAKNIISNTLDVYDKERSNYIDKKFDTFGLYQESLRVFSKIILEMHDIDLEISDINDRITSETTLITALQADIQNMDQQIITRVSNQTSVNNILYISEYERKIYNYTYLTIRIRLKQKLLIAITNDVSIVASVLANLRSQTIPNRTLIDRANKNHNAFVSVQENLTNELSGMVIEYNALRSQFGIDHPIAVTDYDFDDFGLADPTLECFQNLNTFPTTS